MLYIVWIVIVDDDVSVVDADIGVIIVVVTTGIAVCIEVIAGLLSMIGCVVVDVDIYMLMLSTFDMLVIVSYVVYHAVVLLLLYVLRLLHMRVVTILRIVCMSLLMLTMR